MKKKNNDTLPVSTAEEQDCIYAENTADSEPKQGDKEGFDAGSGDKAAEFENLIEDKFKKEFSDKVRNIISRRLKEVKALKEKAEKDAAIVEMIMKKFNVKNGDAEEIERMIDENMNQTANNVNKNATRLIQRLVSENNYLKKENEKRIREAKTQSLAERIRTQAEETKKIYNDFDLKKELNNPEFCRLIRLGVSVKNAYEVINIDGILDNNSKEAEKQVIDSIRYKTNRPVENGSELTGGILLSNGISKLTKKQRAELAKRAASGEKIEF